jgi:hypothetical protein
MFEPGTYVLDVENWRVWEFLWRFFSETVSFLIDIIAKKKLKWFRRLSPGFRTQKRESGTIACRIGKGDFDFIVRLVKLPSDEICPILCLG